MTPTWMLVLQDSLSESAHCFYFISYFKVGKSNQNAENPVAVPLWTDVCRPFCGVGSKLDVFFPVWQPLGTWLLTISKIASLVQLRD